MRNKLKDIVENTRKEVAARKKITPEAMLYLQLPSNPEYSEFLSAITQPKKGNIALIAEIKKSSPSAGVFQSQISAEQRTKKYLEAGADAISYVSDTKYFGGSHVELKQVVDSATIPVLQKDFIIDMYQIVEAAIYNVDALLLIARILTGKELQSFVNFAQINGIEPVVEVYNEADLEKALKTNARVIGVNARNLDTFQIDKTEAVKLINTIPDTITTIGFSGVEIKADVDEYRQAGAKAVLVGTALMNATDINATISELKQ